jgi:hypothetical protein
MSNPATPVDNMANTATNRSVQENRIHLLKHLLIIAGLLGAVVITTTLVGWYIDSITIRWVDLLTGSRPTALAFPAGSPITPEEQGRLKQLFLTIRGRSDLHLNVMNYYYARFVTAIIVFSLTGALAAILLVILGKEGWKAANWGTGTGLIFTAFFVMTAVTVYFNSWPGVFQLERNISDNKVLTLQYLVLENEMLTYAVTREALNYSVSIEDLQSQPVATGAVTSTNGISGTLVLLPSNARQQTLRLGRPMSANDFIHYIDLRLSKDNIAIGFDFKQVPNYENIFSTQ